MTNTEPAIPFVARVFEDFVAAMSLPMVVLGDRLGLYKAMSGARATHTGGTGCADGDSRALRQRVAVTAGCRRIRELRQRHGSVHPSG
jgi:hypothetical protein